MLVWLVELCEVVSAAVLDVDALDVDRPTVDALVVLAELGEDVSAAVLELAELDELVDFDVVYGLLVDMPAVDVLLDVLVCVEVLRT